MLESKISEIVGSITASVAKVFCVLDIDQKNPTYRMEKGEYYL